MNTMVNFKINELVTVFKQKTGWNLSRAKFLAAFIYSLCKLQTVCYVKLAQDLSAKAKVESNLRRIQRFFAGFIVDGNLIAKIIYSMLPTEPPYRLSLDRTQLEIRFGKYQHTHDKRLLQWCWHPPYLGHVGQKGQFKREGEGGADKQVYRPIWHKGHRKHRRRQGVYR